MFRLRGIFQHIFNASEILLQRFILCSEFPHPIRTIYEPYRHQLQRKLSKVAFSADGKNIVTTSDGRGSVIKLWQWSMGATNDVDNPSGMSPIKIV